VVDRRRGRLGTVEISTWNNKFWKKQEKQVFQEDGALISTSGFILNITLPTPKYTLS